MIIVQFSWTEFYSDVPDVQKYTGNQDYFKNSFDSKFYFSNCLFKDLTESGAVLIKNTGSFKTCLFEETVFQDCRNQQEENFKAGAVKIEYMSNTTFNKVTFINNTAPKSKYSAHSFDINTLRAMVNENYEKCQILTRSVICNIEFNIQDISSFDYDVHSGDYNYSFNNITNNKGTASAGDLVIEDDDCYMSYSNFYNISKVNANILNLINGPAKNYAKVTYCNFVRNSCTGQYACLLYFGANTRIEYCSFGCNNANALLLLGFNTQTAIITATLKNCCLEKGMKLKLDNEGKLILIKNYISEGCDIGYISCIEIGETDPIRFANNCISNIINSLHIAFLL